MATSNSIEFHIRCNENWTCILQEDDNIILFVGVSFIILGIFWSRNAYVFETLWIYFFFFGWFFIQTCIEMKHSRLLATKMKEFRVAVNQNRVLMEFTFLNGSVKRISSRSFQITAKFFTFNKYFWNSVYFFKISYISYAILHLTDVSTKVDYAAR